MEQGCADDHQIVSEFQDSAPWELQRHTHASTDNSGSLSVGVPMEFLHMNMTIRHTDSAPAVDNSRLRIGNGDGDEECCGDGGCHARSWPDASGVGERFQRAIEGTAGGGEW